MSYLTAYYTSTRGSWTIERHRQLCFGHAVFGSWSLGVIRRLGLRDRDEDVEAVVSENQIVDYSTGTLTCGNLPGCHHPCKWVGYPHRIGYRSLLVYPQECLCHCPCGSMVNSIDNTDNVDGAQSSDLAFGFHSATVQHRRVETTPPLTSSLSCAADVSSFTCLLTSARHILAVGLSGSETLLGLGYYASSLLWRGEG